jgi:hypothetical protein
VFRTKALEHTAGSPSPGLVQQINALVELRPHISQNPFLYSFQFANHLGVGQLYLAVDRSFSPKPDEAGLYVTRSLYAHPRSESEYNGHAEPKKILSPKESY